MTPIFALEDAPTTTSTRRTEQPIRRHSKLAGREGLFWSRTARQDVRKIVLAARRYELAGRTFGQRNGPLGGVALEVLDFLANLIDYRSGRLDPSLETLMRRLKRSRDAIVRALKALREHGFLDWLRRYVPTGNEGRGPKVQQTSNAYRLSMPKRALALLGRLAKPAPMPDDFSHARDARAATWDAYIKSQTGAEQATLIVEDEEIAARLKSLWSLMDQRKERESAKRSESQTRFIK